MRRREFLKQTAAAGCVAGLPITALAAPQSRASAGAVDALADGADVRRVWVDLAVRTVEPVLSHLAQGTLKRSMPVEGSADRRAVTHLEALGRALAGIAPWLELGPAESVEGRARGRMGEIARAAIGSATDPASPDVLNFTEGTQPLVDAAFLAHAIVRSPRALWTALDEATRRRVVVALTATRRITPWPNNWLLFSAMVEAALCRVGAAWDATRVDYAVRQHAQWYKGDGAYGDGPTFHWDYYNSYVIHPMLVDVLDVCAPERAAWVPLREQAIARARRYAAVLERLIAPDGSFPPIGRSIPYRCGAFQALAQMALRRALPDDMPPAQARSALTAVIRRTLDAPGTFDADGWLRIGLAGHQPGIGESYISTGSLYLCATAFLPLGLPSSDPFWTGPGLAWTGRKAWAGETFPIDAAMKETP